MDSFEFNKVAGAVLGTCLCVLAVSIASGAIFSPKKPAKPGFEIAVKEAPAAGATAKKAPAKPIAVLLASADPKKGQATAKQCQACHNLEKGAGKKIGPDLYGVVGRKRASKPGFNYSSAMKAKGGTWTFDELNKFLTNPRQYIPGTAMTFVGLPRDNQRANVIAYLRTLSDNPLPLPKPPAAAASNDNGGKSSDKGGAQGGKAQPAGNAAGANAPAKPAAGQAATGAAGSPANNPPGGKVNDVTQPSDSSNGSKAPATNDNAKPEAGKTAPKSGPTGGATTNAPTTAPSGQTPPASRQ